jgi:hypothetical protein
MVAAVTLCVQGLLSVCDRQTKGWAARGAGGQQQQQQRRRRQQQTVAAHRQYIFRWRWKQQQQQQQQAGVKGQCGGSQ